jgi:hypothetical protein
MSSADNVTNIKGYAHADRQKIIDDIGARAFLFLRDNAEEMGIPIQEVVAEHMLGMALVMSCVEGSDQTKLLLEHISMRVDDPEFYD